MDEMVNATSAASAASLPDSWVERIFRRLENFYGAKWVDSLGGIDRERVKQAWGEELAGFSPDEISLGLASVRSRVWPPSLPEFLLLCRPLSDSKRDYAEACEQMPLRLRGMGEDRWSRPEVYWAAVAIGAHDLNTFGWEQLRVRWERALAVAWHDPVPPYRAQLPAPGRTALPREEARRRMDEILQRLAREFSPDAIKAGKQWAIDLLHKEADGEYIAFVAHGAWRAALGFDDAISAKDAIASMRRAA